MILYDRSPGKKLLPVSEMMTEVQVMWIQNIDVKLSYDILHISKTDMITYWIC